MKWDVDDVLDRVEKTERQKEKYREMAAVWEEMWRLEGFERTDEEANAVGHRQLTLPTPYNTVNLLCRLIADEPKIDCPARDLNEEEIAISEIKERWLAAMWQMVGSQQRSNPIANAKWQSAVRGYHAFEIKWIENELPAHLVNRRFPILIRNLDPLSVGVREGPFFTEFAYHKYEATYTDLAQRYGKAFRKEYPDESPKHGRGRADEKLPVVDFWYTDDDGRVWNCVIVDEEKFIKKPVKTVYQEIPIVTGAGDISFATDEHWRSLSILHPIKDVWKAENEVASLYMTGLKWYFDPFIWAMNEYGETLPNLDVQPGAVQQYPWGTDIRPLTFQPNTMLAQQVSEMLAKATQEATFPGVMYGQSPGSLQAGYGVSILSNAAQGRIANFQYNLERSIEKVNRIALGLVDSWCRLVDENGEPQQCDGIGVRVWGQRDGEKSFFYETLLASQIDGYYENRARLTPNVPQNDIQDQTLGLRLMEAGIISRQWYRDNLITAPISPDEDKQVLVEQMMQDPEIAKKMMLKAIQKRFPDVWQEIIRETQYDAAYVEQMKQQQMQAQQGPPQGPPPGMMPPQGPPPGMMPPQQGPVQLPQEIGGVVLPHDIQQGMQPPSPNLDAGTIPPELAGQITPEMLGMLRNQIDPVLWATIMGQAMPPPEA